jgi:hypothetical protein
MGRRGSPDIDTTGKLYLHKVPLDSGGYDRGGAYWGAPGTLYEVIDQEGEGYFLRAWSREEAKQKVLEEYPEAKFYR